MPTLLFGEHQIPYILKPSRRRRSLALQVNGDQEVTVLAPHRLSGSSIDRFLHARAAWVLEKLRFFEEVRRQNPPKTYKDGETFLIRGEPHPLEVLVDPRHRRAAVERRDGKLVVRLADAARTPQALGRWYKVEAAAVVEEAIRRLAPILGVVPNRIVIANQKRRWGSCSCRGHLRFNWRVAMMPAAVADYIVVHELAHMRVANHSAKFWAVVQSVMPDFKNLRTWLRANGAQFSLVAMLLCLLPLSAALAESKGSYRFHSPSGKYDLILQRLPDDWTQVKKGKAGAAKNAMKQYGIDLYPAKSSEPVNSIVYSDVNPPIAPEELVHAMLWSPNEAFVVLPDRQKAREQNHVFQLAASLSVNKVWSLEADHVQWIDDHRFIGDLNTKELPGAVIEFDGSLGKADVLIVPDSGIGYQIASITGLSAIIKEILNDRGTGKTTWEHFVPACFELDLESLKKRTTACP